MGSYWAIRRKDDRMELLISDRKSDIVAFNDHDIVRQKTGMIGPDDEIELVKVTYGETCSVGGCDGQNEDEAVWPGVCDVCGLPTI